MSSSRRRCACSVTWRLRQLDVSGGGADAAGVDAHGTPTTSHRKSRGKPYGRSADVWSLGVLFYEILVLRCPSRPTRSPPGGKDRSRGTKCGYSADCAELVALITKTRLNDRSPMPCYDETRAAHERASRRRVLRINANDTTQDDTTDDEDVVETAITKPPRTCCRRGWPSTPCGPKP